MSAIYLLIGVSIPIAAGFLIAFLFASKEGQFDDDYTPSIRILLDEPQPEQNHNTSTKSEA